MKKSLPFLRNILFLVFIFQAANVHSQQKYMLCVGINNYTGNNSDSITSWDGRSIPNLKGCVNDADNISQIFVKYYGFSNANITKLLDRNAKRDSIIANLQRFASICKKDDYMVFYYSGHGSLVYNETTQRNFLKGYQNTIVPADAAVAKVRDIDNHELNDLLLAFTKKQVHLTVIMDACYSGTNTRGTTLYEITGTKEVEPSKHIFIKTSAETKATIPLAQQGAITLAACQDNEEAKELMVSGKNFGAFTYCLCQAITEWSKAAAEEIYSRTAAKLKYLNGKQAPVMESAANRKNKNLPGTATGEQMAASFPLISANGVYQLQGGFLDGLSEGDVLVSNGNNKDTIQVTAINGPERATVKPVNAGGKLKNTSLKTSYSILRLALEPDPPLKIFFDGGLPPAELSKALKEAAAMQKNNSIYWIKPSAGILPQATIYYDVNNMVWKMNINGKLNAVALKNVETPASLSALKGLKVFLQLPHSSNLANLLSNTVKIKKNRNIGIESYAANANYLLTGSFDKNNEPEYGWISMKWKSPELSDIPLWTDFFAENILTSAKNPLYDNLERLSRIASWLTLQSPLPDGTIQFPFTIKIRDEKNNLLADKKKAGKVFTGEILKINFEQDNYTNIKWDNERLFIYVFTIDPKGNILLLFPGERTGIFDYPRSNNDPWLVTIKNTTPGTYHYFFLACKERIINTYVFNQKGVITRSGETFDNALEALINDGGTSGRGNIRTPSNWSLQRVDVLTVDKSANKK